MKEIEIIQVNVLSILKHFSNICTSNNLRFYLVYGTALGSIRHNGFIPWDDDVDVAMPREDFEKFKTIYLKDYQISSYYKLRGNFETNYPYNFLKIDDSRTTLIENQYINSKYIGGIYIDIFPIDGTYSNKILRFFRYKRINMLIKMIYSFDKYFDSNTSLLKKIAIRYVKLFYKKNKLILILERTLKRCKYDKSKYVGICIGAYGMKEFFLKSVFEDGSINKFCDKLFPVPSDFEYYLTQIYGDYRQLPSIDKRVSHHEYTLDLKKGYLN